MHEEPQFHEIFGLNSRHFLEYSKKLILAVKRKVYEGRQPERTMTFVGYRITRSRSSALPPA